ncbi:hypothetical protein Rhe02_00300 [Rhizocola hellebori]|uniref:PrsW family intramembrane metalloprotease n=1 Tax=Rhizocola hellebori TaxID=1392758 RepID=A0A8J3VD50_9ACTN|nr:hypothetical protein [Rhizocola hellebori]GIH01963.1 hypothetical protein Rhe02_00300 [Rhizocola hellebori]
MTLYMVLAAGYGVLQLAALGWLAGRSVRISTAALCIAVGMYGCGVATLILQAIYTRGVAELTGERMADVVRVASYTVDPFFEEIVKVTPLLLVGMHLRTRFQLGLTDYLVLGGALGAGFGLLEAILRFSHLAGRAIAVPDGWIVPSGLSATYVPDAGAIAGSWLPAPASSGLLVFVGGPDTFLHLAWSAIGGLGVGVLLRGRGLARVAGPLAIIFVAAQHAAVNYDLALLGKTGFGDALAAPFLAANRLLWLLPLLGLMIAGFFDRRDVTRLGTALPAAPSEFALLGLPWTLLVALRFSRLRRSLAYARARGPEPSTAALYHALATIRWLIDRANSRTAWRHAPGLNGDPPRRLITAAVRNWQVWVWLGLLLPSLLYFVAGGFPATASLQKALASPALSWLLIVFLAGGLLWLMWQSTVHLRLLSKALGQPHAESATRSRLQLMSAAGALVGGAFGLYLLLTGTPMWQQAITSFHVLAALAGAIVAVLVVLTIAALFTMFPPGGLALAGGLGTLAPGLAISSSMLLEAGLVGAITGVVLMEAADSGGGGDGGGSGSRPRGPNEDRFPEDDFDGTGSSMDELAELTYRHTGAGDMHIGGSAARPTQAEILDTLGSGTRSELTGQNAVQYVRDGVKVIINRDMPWRSTAYYIGG